MNHLSAYVGIAFGIITLATVWLFFIAANKDKRTLIALLLLLLAQAVPALYGFFTTTDTVPPRLLLLPALPMIAIATLFVSRRGRAYLAGVNQQWLTALHIVRIPVEIILYTLFAYHMVPKLMTFEGANLDIISGITAPLVWYYGFRKQRMGRMGLLVWNIACLLLLINIVTIAVLSMASPFQQLAFDQPNVAILYFPFVWLPGCVVPLVLLAHVASIWKICAAAVTNKQTQQTVAAVGH